MLRRAGREGRGEYGHYVIFYVGEKNTEVSKE